MHAATFLHARSLITISLFSGASSAPSPRCARSEASERDREYRSRLSAGLRILATKPAGLILATDNRRWRRKARICLSEHTRHGDRAQEGNGRGGLARDLLGARRRKKEKRRRGYARKEREKERRRKEEGKNSPLPPTCGLHARILVHATRS